MALPCAERYGSRASYGKPGADPECRLHTAGAAQPTPSRQRGRPKLRNPVREANTNASSHSKTTSELFRAGTAGRSVQLLAKRLEVAHRLHLIVFHRLVAGENPVAIRLESHADALVERRAEAVGVGKADDDGGMSETSLR